MAGVINPVSGVADQFSGAMNKINPPSPLPTPVSKSLLFEIIDTVTSMVVESFALVIPPTAMSIREPQRVNVTKTFGNVFVDDYGPDNPQIMIKGWSGTSHAFPTYDPTGMSADAQNPFGMQSQVEATAQGDTRGYTHRIAFYEFRDRIIRYKYSYKDRYSDMKLRVYDLNDLQSYDCILMDFSCDRDASRPLYYPYSITLLVYNMPDVLTDVVPEIVSVGGMVDKIIDGINTGMDWIQAGFGFVNGVMGMVATIQNSLQLISARITADVNAGGALAIAPLQAARGLIDSVASFMSIIDAAKTQGYLVKSAYMNAKEMLQDSWRQSIRLYGQSISLGYQRSRTETLQFDEGVLITSLLQSGNSEMGVAAASRNSRNRDFSFNGFTLYDVKAQDTLQSVAQSQLGDSTLWPYIAKVNSIVNNVELHQKTQIYIPSQNSVNNKDAYIISERADRDPFGTDIKLDDTGDFMISGNDFVLVSGQTNVFQWVNMILGTRRGSILKHTAVGLTALVGGPGDNMALGYLVTSIRTALQQDPRIKRVTNVIADIDGDVIRLNLSLDLVGYDKTLPLSVVL